MTDDLIAEYFEPVIEEIELRHKARLRGLNNYIHLMGWDKPDLYSLLKNQVYTVNEFRESIGLNDVKRSVCMILAGAKCKE